MTAARLPKDLAALVDHISDVCPIPAAAQRVLALTCSEDADAREVTDALACDAAMAAHVLRVANSAVYARTRRVTELHQAVMAIGLTELRNIAAAMSLLAAYASDEELSVILHESSALSGAIARMVATEFMPDWKGLTLVCGLLCEVGSLACLAVDGPGYTRIWNTICEKVDPWSPVGLESRDQLERERYGTTSRELGARLLRRNMLPEEIAGAIEAPSPRGEEPSTYGCITMFARQASWMLIAMFDTGDASEIDEMLHELALTTQLGDLDRSRLHKLCVSAAVDTELSLRKLVPRI